MKNETVSARSSRRSAGLQSGLNLILVIFLLLGANYLGFKYYAHQDLSTSQFYTLSPKTTDVLRSLQGPLHISTLLIDRQNRGYWDESLNLLEEYQRVGGKNVTVEKVDPVYDRARAVELMNRLHFAGTDNVFIFQYSDPHDAPDAPPRSHLVKLSDLIDQNPMTGQVSGYKGEQEFTSAIVSLVEGKASKVYFTAGHGEHPTSDMQTANGFGAIADVLKGENLTIDTLNLAAKGDVPADAEAVIVAGPTVPFSPAEAQAIDKYLAANGKLFVLLDPAVSCGLDDVLRKYELSFDNDLVLSRVVEGGQVSTTPLAYIQGQGFSSHPITAKFPDANYGLGIVSARSVRVQPDSSPSPRAQPLMMTGPEAWGWVLKANMTDADLMGLSSRTFNKMTDIPGPMVIAAAYDAGTVTDPKTKEQSNGTRLVVAGSSHFLENDTIGGSPVAANFFINAVDWLAKKNATLDISPKQPQVYGVSLSPMSENTVMWTAFAFIPGAALALGLFAWFSRRK
jgi:ABC-type uncharacterized transport system involved in gliding motility auxiliary subunit